MFNGAASGFFYIPTSTIRPPGADRSFQDRDNAGHLVHQRRTCGQRRNRTQFPRNRQPTGIVVDGGDRDSPLRQDMHQAGTDPTRSRPRRGATTAGGVDGNSHRLGQGGFLRGQHGGIDLGANPDGGDDRTGQCTVPMQPHDPVFPAMPRFVGGTRRALSTRDCTTQDTSRSSYRSGTPGLTSTTTLENSCPSTVGPR